MSTLESWLLTRWSASRSVRNNCSIDSDGHSCCVGPGTCHRTGWCGVWTEWWNKAIVWTTGARRSGQV